MKTLSLASLAALALACGGAIDPDPTPPRPPADAAPPDVAQPEADAAPPAETICRLINPTTGGEIAELRCSETTWHYWDAVYPATGPGPAITCGGVCSLGNTCQGPDGSALGFCARAP